MHGSLSAIAPTRDSRKFDSKDTKEETGTPGAAGETLAPDTSPLLGYRHSSTDHWACKRTRPACIRSDNGPEFIAQQVHGWLASLEVETLFIEPRGAVAKRLLLHRSNSNWGKTPGDELLPHPG